MTLQIADVRLDTRPSRAALLRLIIRRAGVQLAAHPHPGPRRTAAKNRLERAYCHYDQLTLEDL